MNAQINPTQKIPYTVTEVDASGNTVTPKSGDACTLVSSDTASVTVAPDISQFAGGFLKAGSKLQTGVTVTATITHADNSTPFVATTQIDVVAGPAVGDAISLGTPIPQ